MLKQEMLKIFDSVIEIHRLQRKKFPEIAMKIIHYDYVDHNVCVAIFYFSLQYKV